MRDNDKHYEKYWEKLDEEYKKKFEEREKAAGKRAEKEEERGIRDFVMEMMKEKAETIPAQTLLEKFRELRKLEKPDIDRSSTGMSEEDFEELLAQILYYQLEAEEEAFLTALAAKEAEEEALRKFKTTRRIKRAKAKDGRKTGDE